jgi:hypothetical protein
MHQSQLLAELHSRASVHPQWIAHVWAMQDHQAVSNNVAWTDAATKRSFMMDIWDRSGCGIECRAQRQQNRELPVPTILANSLVAL